MTKLQFDATVAELNTAIRFCFDLGYGDGARVYVRMLVRFIENAAF